MSLTKRDWLPHEFVDNPAFLTCQFCGQPKEFSIHNIQKPTTGAAIFFTLWVKYPKLLYINYLENAKLLAWWLEVEDEYREFDGMDGYCVNQLSAVTNYSSARVIEELYRAIERLKVRREPSAS